MDDYSNRNISKPNEYPTKRPWSVGPNTVVVIDKRLVDRLGIREDNTLFEQMLTDGGIFLRIKRV